jgi:GNAT superfamily N-acetyltransferase
MRLAWNMPDALLGNETMHGEVAALKALKIVDASDSDMKSVNNLFGSQKFPPAPSAEGVRIALDDGKRLLGAIYVEVAPDGTDNVKTVVVDSECRGHGVGAALMEDALRTHPDLRLVSRGVSVGFYEALGFKRCTWDDIDPQYKADCDSCEDFPTCFPVPFRSAL